MPLFYGHCDRQAFTRLRFTLSRGCEDRRADCDTRFSRAHAVLIFFASCTRPDRTDLPAEPVGQFGQLSRFEVTR